MLCAIRELQLCVGKLRRYIVKKRYLFLLLVSLLSSSFHGVFAMESKSSWLVEWDKKKKILLSPRDEHKVKIHEWLEENKKNIEEIGFVWEGECCLGSWRWGGLFSECEKLKKLVVNNHQIQYEVDDDGCLCIDLTWSADDMFGKTKLGRLTSLKDLSVSGFNFSMRIFDSLEGLRHVFFDGTFYGVRFDEEKLREQARRAFRISHPDLQYRECPQVWIERATGKRSNLQPNQVSSNQERRRYIQKKSSFFEANPDLESLTICGRDVWSNSVDVPYFTLTCVFSEKDGLKQLKSFSLIYSEVKDEKLLEKHCDCSHLNDLEKLKPSWGFAYLRDLYPLLRAIRELPRELSVD